jgi:spore germination protein YaaH
MLLFSSSLLAFASPSRGELAPLSFPGPHAAQDAQYGPTADGPSARGSSVPPRGFLPVPRPGPDLKVYGYLAYWQNDLGTVPWDDLTHIAIFSAGATSSGTLTETSRWDIADDAVLLAEPYGVRVHLCVTNFDPDSLDALLSSATARDTLIAELVEWQALTGAHGVNIDFEGLPYSVKSEFVTFIADLEAAVGEVVLAGPSVDWAGSFDYDQLTLYSDIFIMGYGYHWGGSSYAGPTDPLYAGAGTIWEGVQSYSLSWSLDDYQTYGALPDRVILGLPLYGYAWSTNNNNVPTSTLGTGDSVTFAQAWDDEATYGRNWEPDSRSPYTYGGGQQIWYGDEESVRERIAYVRDETDIAGIGFWALHYDGDDPSFWDMIHDETHLGEDPPDTTDTTDTTGTDTGTGDPTEEEPGDPDDPKDPPFVADAGLPFLAYVADTVVLSGTGSQGPDGVELQYRWTQISGPPVKLSSDTEVEPVFRVDAPGVHTFELLVGDGSTWSEPASSFVVVIDPALAERGRSSCGCRSDLGLLGGWGGALVLALLLGRRSRR